MSAAVMTIGALNLTGLKPADWDLKLIARAAVSRPAPPDTKQQRNDIYERNLNENMRYRRAARRADAHQRWPLTKLMTNSHLRRRRDSTVADSPVASVS